MKIRWKKALFEKAGRLKGVWFHLLGIACIIWFLVRVVPAPHRIRYPCQQMSVSVALAYVAFWSGILHGLLLLLRRAKSKFTVVAPTFLVVLILFFSVSGMVFGVNFLQVKQSTLTWDPVPNDPIGTPKGSIPGRVVWVWNPDATPEELEGYWWESQNNNQSIIEKMFSQGIQSISDASTDASAWHRLFSHFNLVNNNGDKGFQTGEKIAIKVNVNNCWEESYANTDNNRDANPYVVKALLRQLINTVGVPQEDITVYDASRPFQNWFYDRVYYETYPAETPMPEFPNVNFVDARGEAPGRQQAQPSDTRVYFARGLCRHRTLPQCVADADYLINMPILKRHPIENGVTLSGKNMFGSWIEEVYPIHQYHKSGLNMGNPAPQTDLLGHKDLGKKTVLFLGDGTYATKQDHCIIDKFNMYPFNGDWTNSLFFSQDPVALDSVMYDFLKEEGTHPIEGSQNYLHQAATPPDNVYDPENDGEYLSESLGVHEHWNTEVDIFSPYRYSGVDANGIDFVALGSEHASFGITIKQPERKYLYIAGKAVKPLRDIEHTIIIGKITVKAAVNTPAEQIDRVEFYVDNTLMHTDQSTPYEWQWETQNPLIGQRNLTVTAVSSEGKTTDDGFTVWKIL